MDFHVYGNHVCYHCDDLFAYESNLKNKQLKSLIRVEKTKLANAEIALLDNNKVEVLVKCPKCGSKNKFFA